MIQPTFLYLHARLAALFCTCHAIMLSVLVSQVIANEYGFLLSAIFFFKFYLDNSSFVDVSTTFFSCIFIRKVSFYARWLLIYHLIWFILVI